LPVTFDNEDASRSGIELVSIRHPLVRAAVHHFGSDQTWIRRYGSVRVKCGPRGDFVVVVYLVDTTGLRPSLELWPIAVDTRTFEVVDGPGDALLAAVAEGGLADEPAPPDDVVEACLDVAEAHVAFEQHRTEAERQRENHALVDAGHAAREASFEQKIARARETLEAVTGRRQLERLYNGRIANLETRRDDALADLDARRKLAVLVRPIAVAAVRAG
jgi:hypothetical protein